MSPVRGEELTGTVVRLGSRLAQVSAGDATLRCSLRKNLFRDLGEFSKPVAVGDRVRVLRPARGLSVVEEVLPRRGYLSRRLVETGKEQVIVANVDQVMVTVSLKDPDFRPRLIDRVLVAAERGGFDALIVFNKVDLVEDRKEFEDYANLYRGLGYEVVFASAETGEGVERIAERLTDRITVLAGHSGVGKSSLLNAIQPDLDIRSRAISDKWGKGRHTTTAVTLHRLDRGGWVADTPGMRSFAIAGLEPSDIAIFFRDLAPFVDHCRFSECTHDHEPDCAVIAAAEAGEIDLRRYESYLRILHGMDEEP